MACLLLLQSPGWGWEPASSQVLEILQDREQVILVDALFHVGPTACSKRDNSGAVSPS